MKVLTHAKTKEQTSSKHYCFWNLTLGPLQGPPVLPWNTLRVSELSLIHVLWNLGLARLGLHPGLKGVTVFLSGLFWALPHQFSPAEERLDPLMPTHPLAPHPHSVLFLLLPGISREKLISAASASTPPSCSLSPSTTIILTQTQ